MASKALNNPLIRTLTKRGFAQTAPAVADVTIAYGALPNKTVLSAVPTNSPLTRVTIAFRAGSRYEPCNELGVSHVLRLAAGLSTSNVSAFMVNRQLSQIGATISAAGDREFVYYTLEASKANLLTALDYLTNIVSGQEFRAWELTDNLPRLKYEITALPQQVRAVDLLHRAAYRRNLGNSLFVAPKRMAKISSESVQHYAATCLTGNRCAISVVGDYLEVAQLVGKNLSIPDSCNTIDEPATYIGGDLRKEIGGELAHIAIAVHGAAVNSPNSLALAIAAKALGNGPITKWGNDNSILSATIGNIGPFAAAGFNLSYTDSGLFGVILSVPKDQANQAVRTVGSMLKNPCVSAGAIKAGKNQLKLQIFSESETGSTLSESMAAQGLYFGRFKSAMQMAREIDEVSDSAVMKALAEASKSRLSMGAVGNLSYVPYSDEIC